MPSASERTATLDPRDGGARGETCDTDLPEAAWLADDPGRYEPIGEHARGGLGRVVRAIDHRLRRTVAVKQLLRHDEWHAQRFVREALITARLQHPGIVPVHEAGRWPNGEPYYVMKLVAGRTLKEVIADTRTLRDRLALLPTVVAVADATAYAHSEGVIHRDLKPANVVMGEFGETVVVDWGLAVDRTEVEEVTVATRSASVALSTSGSIVGTPAYMPPDQARGEPVDERADVYALGAILYEVLAGEAPYADAPAANVLDLVIAGAPTPLRRRASRCPRELAGIVAKAMARDARDRYDSARSFADDLRRYQTGKLVSAHAYPTWQLLRKKLAQYPRVAQVIIASVLVVSSLGVQALRGGGMAETCDANMHQRAPRPMLPAPVVVPATLRASSRAHVPCYGKYVTVAGSQIDPDDVAVEGT
jgi:serine/threonine protein kinase